MPEMVRFPIQDFLLPDKLRYFKENLVMDLNHFLSATGDPPVERDDQLSEGIRAVFMSHQPEVMEEPISFVLFFYSIQQIFDADATTNNTET